MSARRIALVSLTVAIAGASFTPAFAAKPHPQPHPAPIDVTYTATATPDPLSTNPVSGVPCHPKLPGSMYSRAFVIPAAGTLSVQLNNTLDWSLVIRDSSGASLAESDGGLPTDKESAFLVFKKRTPVSIDTCNFLGEPSISVHFRFTYS